ncbi:MAG: tetratricopeptide repeat protein [Rhodobacteraceae bacterium]|nr:tetratricopeptide repeat protein [Paracoccaceae bacterium]
MTANLKRIVTVIALCCAASQAPAAGGPDLEGLYRQLADPDNPDWQIAQADILREWSKSGSPALDLLLRRGQDAMEAGDLAAAIEHLTALTDHAPDFAEGWNARATAYFLNGDFGPSIADIRMTLALNPHHFGALAGLGQIFEGIGRPDQALKAYEAALRINPHMDGVRQAVERLRRDTEGTAL